MSRRRWSLTALFALTAALLVAGCGGSDNESSGGTTTSEKVSGSVSVMGIWVSEEQKAFQAVLDAFKEQQPDVDVKYQPVGDNLPTVLSTAVQGGNPPDVAAIAQPGFMIQLAQQGKLKPIEFAKQATIDNFGQSVVDSGSVDGKFYGLTWKVNNKSTIWYNVKAYDDAGVKAAETWDDYLKNAGTINASGLPAYSVGGADGWTLTDLFENIYLRTAGPEKYDQLAKHEIKWTDPSVKEALTEMGKVFSDTKNIAGGTSGALQTDFPTSVGNVLSATPKAAQVMEGDFVPIGVKTTLKPVEGYNVFPFPSVKGSPEVVVTSGNLFVIFHDTPAVEAFINYMTTPESAEVWVKLGGFASPNKNVPLDTYPDPLLKSTSEGLKNAKTFRFDMSDLAPAAFGATQGQGEWKLLQDFLQNPSDVDGIAQKLETSAAAAFK
jgi:alpha-glucoside transport system substrate-binding protein